MGATDSNMLREFHNVDPPQEEVGTLMKAENNACVMVGMPEDMDPAFVYLAFEAGSWITGQDIKINEAVVRIQTGLSWS